MMYDDIKNDLNEVHFKNKFVKTEVVQRSHKEVGNGVDKPVNQDIFHSFVQNWAVLKELLMLVVGFFKNISKQGIAEI